MIRQKLASLESTSVSQSDPLVEHRRHLATILGTADGLYWPYRYARGSGSMAGLLTARESYRSDGWPYTVTGIDAAGWKSDERLRKSMAAAGLVTIGTTGQITLTPATMERVRAGLGLVTLAGPVCNYLVVSLQQHADTESHHRRAGGWIGESLIFGKEYTGSSSDWHDQTVCMVPMLTAGIVESTTTTASHIYYRATGIEYPSIQPFDAADISDQSETYWDAWQSAVESQSRYQSGGSRVVIPLSATA